MVDITDIAMATEEDRLHSADEAAEEALLDALLEDWFSVHCPNGATQRSHCCTCSSHRCTWLHLDDAVACREGGMNRNQRIDYAFLVALILTVAAASYLYGRIAFDLWGRQ